MASAIAIDYVFFFFLALIIFAYMLLNERTAWLYI